MKLKQNITLSIVTSLLLYSNIHADDVNKLEKFTVTAQKTEENIQNVPISITLLNEFKVKDKNLERIEDIAAHTPNLMFFTYGSDNQSSPSIRGIFADIESKVSPTAVYLDGVPIIDAWSMNEDLNNIERIEVLKGPQGTLYGKNSESGVINIHTKQPTNEVETSIGLEFGSDKKRKLNLNASGPIIKDKFLIGINATHYEKQGILKHATSRNTIDDRERRSGRLNLLYNPNDNLQFSLISSIQKHNDGAVKMNGTNFMTMELLNKDQINSNMQGYNKSKIVNNSLKIKYDLSDNSYIESVTTSRVFNHIDGDDWDFSEADMFHMIRDAKTKSYSQEIRYIDTFLEGKLDFLAGVYMDKKDEDYRFTFRGNPLMKDFNDKSIGLFAHTKYKINPQLALQTGIRIDKESKKFKNLLNNVQMDTDYNEVSPKISLEYRLDTNTLTYATIAKGYRAGGFNHMAPPEHQDNLSFEEESLWNYELGYKSKMLDNSLTVNAAIYYMDIKDMQIKNATYPSTEYVSNAAKANSKGLELEIDYSLNDAINLFSSFGFNKTTYDDFKDNKGDYSGNSNFFAPKYNFNIGAQYRAENGYYGKVEIYGYGKMYLNKENTSEKKAYNLVDLKLGYETQDFDIYLYGKNIFNKNHDTLNYSKFYTIYSEPREIGIQLAYRF